MPSLLPWVESKGDVSAVYPGSVATVPDLYDYSLSWGELEFTGTLPGSSPYALRAPRRRANTDVVITVDAGSRTTVFNQAPTSGEVAFYDATGKVLAHSSDSGGAISVTMTPLESRVMAYDLWKTDAEVAAVQTELNALTAANGSEILYVSAEDGDDSNGGGPGDPYETANAAFDAAEAGDATSVVIFFLPGTYTYDPATQGNNLFADIDVFFGGVPGRSILHFDASTEQAPSIRTSGASGMHFQFSDTGWNASSSSVYVSGARFSNCVFEVVSLAGVTSARGIQFQVADAIWENCTFLDDQSSSATARANFSISGASATGLIARCQALFRLNKIYEVQNCEIISYSTVLAYEFPSVAPTRQVRVSNSTFHATFSGATSSNVYGRLLYAESSVGGSLNIDIDNCVFRNDIGFAEPTDSPSGVVQVMYFLDNTDNVRIANTYIESRGIGIMHGHTDGGNDPNRLTEIRNLSLHNVTIRVVRAAEAGPDDPNTCLYYSSRGALVTTGCTFLAEQESGTKTSFDYSAIRVNATGLSASQQSWISLNDTFDSRPPSVTMTSGALRGIIDLGTGSNGDCTLVSPTLRVNGNSDYAFLGDCDQLTIQGMASFNVAPTAESGDITWSGESHANGVAVESAGSASTPAIRFTDGVTGYTNEGTGFYWDSVRLTAAIDESRVMAIDEDGNLYVNELFLGPVGDQDVRLYRASANLLRTPDSLTVDGNLTLSGNHWCSLRRTVVQSVSDSTYTQVLFNAEYVDVGGLHSTSVNTARVTIVETGTYLLCFQVYYTSATGRKITFVGINGASGTGDRRLGLDDRDSGRVCNGSAIVNLTAGDYVSVFCWQNSGGAIDISSVNASFQNEFQVARIR